MAHAATNCNCTTWGPCPTCGYAWEPTFATVDLSAGAVYGAIPDPPKKVPLTELFPMGRPNRATRRCAKAKLRGKK